MKANVTKKIALNDIGGTVVSIVKGEDIPDGIPDYAVKRMIELGLVTAPVAEKKTFSFGGFNVQGN